MNTWTTADGQTLEISKMTDSHVINTYNYLKRKLDEDVRDFPCFQGEMAQYYAEAEYDHTNRENTVKINTFAEEIKRRGLTI